MARQGLDRARVVDAGCALADADGLGAVTLAGVAGELGVRTPSLYNHVEGLDGLRRGIALRGIAELTERMRAAAVGRSGPDALLAAADACRAYAHTHPGRYAATVVAAPDDAEIATAGAASVAVLSDILRHWDLEGDDAIHAVRIVRSAIHGFVTLELSGGFGIPLDRDASFRRLIGVVAAGLDGAS